VSGPKGASYTVVSAEELKRRALAAATARWQAQCTRYQELAADVEAARAVHGDVISPLASLPQVVGTTSDDYDRCAAVVDELVSSCDGSYRAQLGQARASTVMGALAALIDAVPVPEPTASDARSAREKAPSYAPSSPFGQGEHVRRALARLDPEAGETARERAESLAEQALLAPSAARSGQLVRALEDVVQRANTAQKQRRRRDADFEELRRALAGLDTDQVCETVERLDAAQAGGSDATPELRSLVAEVAGAARTEQDRRFALNTAVACLEEMGYEAGVGFDTVVSQGGAVHLRRAGWPGYAVQLRARHSGAELGFNVVCFAADQPSSSARDAEVEREWCADFAELRRAARRKGLDLALTRQENAGALPVQRVAGSSRSAARTVGRARPQSRTRVQRDGGVS